MDWLAGLVGTLISSLVSGGGFADTGGKAKEPKPELQRMVIKPKGDGYSAVSASRVGDPGGYQSAQRDGMVRLQALQNRNRGAV